MNNLREQYAKLFAGKPSTNDNVLIENTGIPSIADEMDALEESLKELLDDDPGAVHAPAITDLMNAIQEFREYMAIGF